MKMDKIQAEIKRQLALKSEITLAGPPLVALNGDELLEALVEQETQLEAFEEEVLQFSAENAELRAQRDELLEQKVKRCKCPN